MDHSYPTIANDHSSFDMNMDSSLSFGSHNPYQRFLSPSPTCSSIRRRSSSVPYSDYSDFLDAPRYNRGRRHAIKTPRESRLVNPDIIDRLDTAARFSYHHEGPYDAVYPERNKDSSQSPLDALRESNAEALKATPYHKIADSINRQRPLDGVAYYPPGHTDNEGQTYDYEEGYNMMTDYGNFARFPGRKFTDDDFKNDPFYNKPPKAFGVIRNVFRRKHRVST
ncbi:hypothetical protein BDW59DRAFT_169625 [Aspergillus cavernicola]|uniref:Pal1 cell morphology protein-domain-containing protein n=1 Tax=Aspergillus cavernicola TaxID=176166 RepID=A0ABR4IVL3_9EURO